MRIRLFFSMAYLFVLSKFWGPGLYGITAVKMGCDNAKRNGKGRPQRRGPMNKKGCF